MILIKRLEVKKIPDLHREDKEIYEITSGGTRVIGALFFVF